MLFAPDGLRSGTLKSDGFQSIWTNRKASVGGYHWGIFSCARFTASSTVKTAPHFGHFTLVSLETPAQPKEKANKTAMAKIKLTVFFNPLHLLSLNIYTSILQISTAKFL
jgi:hypothetical protein